MVGFAPDCAGRGSRYPGLLAHEKGTHMAALTLTCGNPEHGTMMAASDPQVKPGVTPRSVQERLLQAICHAIRVVRSKGDMQPGGLGQCRPDKIDDCTAAGQDNAVIVDITAQFGRYLAQQVHNHPGDTGNMLFDHGEQITYWQFQGCG